MESLLSFGHILNKITCCEVRKRDLDSWSLTLKMADPCAAEQLNRQTDHVNAFYLKDLYIWRLPGSD
jgi:hypothetical protein